MTRVGIVTGMAFEAECLRAALRRHPDLPKPRIQVTGARRGRAEATARNLIAEGATALLSFGVAGGLDPDLKPGDLIIADHILSVNGPILAADSRWVHAVLEGLGDIAAIRTLPILSVDNAVQNTREKARLFKETGAGAVDMESYGTARAASSADLPMLAVRVVADSASRSLPKLASGAIRSNGTVRLRPVLAGLLQRPHDIVRMIGVGRDTARARRVLRRVAFRDLPALLRR